MQWFRAAILCLAAVFGLVSAGVGVAAPSCSIGAELPTPHSEGPTEREPQRVVPIGGYTLAMSWMPQYCRKGDAAECALYRTAGTRRDGLSLHGLWPDGRAKDWPQYCAAAAILPARTIAAHACATPSAQLLQHEWSKHGTCMAGYTPDSYFDLSNRLFAGVRVPQLRGLSYRPQTVASVTRAIAAANPGMTADMVRLNLDKQGWLEEIWLCLDTRFKTTSCAATKDAARGNDKVLIWRGGRDRDGDQAGGDRARYRRAGYYRRDYGRGSATTR